MEEFSSEKIIEIMKKIRFFNEFTEEELALLLKIAKWVKFEQGDLIIKEGALEKTFFIIIKGRVVVKKKKGFLPFKKTISILSSGESFGEMAFITGSPRSADIAVEETTYALKFDSDDIQKEQGNPQYIRILFKFFKKFSATLAERLERANRELANPITF
jgi:serine/threonine-protein kinase